MFLLSPMLQILCWILDFKKRSVNTVLFVSIITGSLFYGCYFDLEYSPFITKVDHEELNKKNLALIKQIESKKISAKYFKIGVMSDVHHFYSKTEKIINFFNGIHDLDFVMIVGDVTDEGLLREYNLSYEIIKKLNIPFIVLIGNHDCLSYGIDIYEDMYGELNFNFTYMDVEFICFNNNNWESGDPDYGWLAKTAAASIASSKILFSHIQNHSSCFNRFTEEQINLFNNILTDNNVNLTIHGHAHEDSSFVIINDIPRYEIGSPDHGHYMIITYDSGFFKVEQCLL